MINLRIEKRIADWVAGKETGIVFEDRNVDFAKYLPVGEKQYTMKADLLDCVTFGFTNCIEVQLQYLLDIGSIKREDFADYFDADYRFNFSDRFLAKMSGTTKNGNSLQKVIDSAREYGLVAEKDWPTSDNMTWDEYYAEIPEEVKKKALKFKDLIEIKYEWAVNGKQNYGMLVKHLKQAPLMLATPICPGWNSGEPAAKCTQTESQHCHLLYKADEKYLYSFDSYTPYTKKLPLDYPIYWAMKVVCYVKKAIEKPATPVIPPVVMPRHLFRYTLAYGTTNEEVRYLQTALKAEGLFTLEPTGYFGPYTLDAVKKFQLKYKKDILDASKPKLLAPTGFVGTLTLAKLNELYYNGGTKSVLPTKTMASYSTTQASNVTVIAAALALILTRFFNVEISAEDIGIMIAGAVVAIAAITSFVNRFKKGDVTVAGFRK